MGWTARIVIAVIVLLVVGGAALGLYESGKPPVTHAYEEPVATPTGNP